MKPFRRLSCLFATGVLCLFALTLPGKALAVLEGDPIPVSTANDDQQNPFVIALPDKNLWFVVWEDWSDLYTTGTNIYGQFINSDGIPCGGKITVSNSAGDQTVPTAAYRDTTNDSGDKILVAWQDSRSSKNFLGFVEIAVSDIETSVTDGTCTASNYTLGSLEHEVSFTALRRYRSSSGTTASVGDTLISRKSPKAVYDRPSDLFWLGWIESRSAIQQISEIAFASSNPTVVGWQFGKPDFAGYVALDAADLNEEPVGLLDDATDNADIIRNGTVYTCRLLSSSHQALTESFEYEFFTNINNISLAADQLLPERFFVWEGVRKKALMTNTCTDENENTVCDPGESVASTLSPSDSDDGLIHIYGIYQKEILQPSTSATWVDFNNTTSAGYFPAAEFDPVHRKMLVAWEDLRDSNQQKIYGQLFQTGGAYYNANFIISYQDGDGDGSQDANIEESKQTRPQVSYDSTNQRFFTTWQDGRNSRVSLENLDIYGQDVDSEGSMRGDNYPICTASSNQLNPVTAFNRANHQFLTVWKDARNVTSTFSDIYGQRYSLGKPQLTVLDSDTGAILVPPLIDFGTLYPGEVTVKGLTLKNTGDTTIHIDCVSPYPLTEPFYYVDLPTELRACECDPENEAYAPSICANGGTLNLVPSSQTAVSVRFAHPVKGGTFIDSFTIQSDATAATTINLTGAAIGIQFLPSSVSFPTITVGETAKATLQIVNYGVTDLTVSSITAVAPFSASGANDGKVLGAGKTMTETVTFAPTKQGTFSSSMQVAFSGIDTILSVPLSAAAQSSGGSSTDRIEEANTSAIAYSLTLNAATDKAGQLFVLASHDRLTGSNSYAYTSDKQWQLFAQGTTPVSGWADLAYAADVATATSVVFSPLDLSDKGGVLKIGTFAENSTRNFDFADSLIELVTLTVHTFDGQWSVTDTYTDDYGQHEVVEPFNLEVTDQNGSINAKWGPNDVTISYGEGSGYVLDFVDTTNHYYYRYTITALDDTSFSGTWARSADGTTYSSPQPTAGRKIQ